MKADAEVLRAVLVCVESRKPVRRVRIRACLGGGYDLGCPAVGEGAREDGDGRFGERRKGEVGCGGRRDGDRVKESRKQSCRAKYRSSFR